MVKINDGLSNLDNMTTYFQIITKLATLLRLGFNSIIASSIFKDQNCIEKL